MNRHREENFEEAKRVVDLLLKDFQVVSAASNIVQTGKKAPEFAAAFDKLSSVVAKYRLPKQRIVFVAKDGRYVYSNSDSETSETVMSVENHMTRPEIFTAMLHEFGGKVGKYDKEEKKRMPKAARKMMTEGYMVEIRRSGTTGNLENYVAKAHKPFLNQAGFVVRVSVVSDPN